MTVAELRAALAAFPDDAVVVLDDGHDFQLWQPALAAASVRKDVEGCWVPTYEHGEGVPAVRVHAK